MKEKNNDINDNNYGNEDNNSTRWTTKEFAKVKKIKLNEASNRIIRVNRTKNRLKAYN